MKNLDEIRAPYEACIKACEKEGRMMDEERAKGHHALKDERRARAESAYYCAQLCRDLMDQAVRALPRGPRETETTK